MNNCFNADTPANNGLERFLLNIWNDFSKDFSVSFINSEDDGFATRSATTLALNAMCAKVKESRADLGIVRLHLSGRGSWRAEVDTGASIELGRGTVDEVRARSERFVRTLAAATAKWRAPLEHADLRHRDGYAVRLRGYGLANAADKAAPAPSPAAAAAAKTN